MSCDGVSERREELGYKNTGKPRDFPVEWGRDTSESEVGMTILLVVDVFDFVVFEFFDVIVVDLHDIVCPVGKVAVEVFDFAVAVDDASAFGNALEFVAFGVELGPEQVFEFGDVVTCNGADEDDGEVVGEILTEHFHEFFVEEVALGDGKDAVLVEQPFVETSHFVEQDFVFALDVVGVAGYHEEQKRVALDVAEESQSQSTSLGCALDDAGNVGYDEGTSVAVGHDAERGFEGGEGIVGNLGAGVGERADQRRLTGVGEADQTDIGEELQFQDHHHFLHGLAGLGVARCLVGGGAKLEIAQSAASAFEQHHDLSVFDDIAEIFTGFGIVGHGAGRYLDVAVCAITAVAAAFAAVAAVAGKNVAVIAQVEQRPVVAVAAEVDITPTPTIAAIGATEGLVFGAVHVHRTAAALTGATVDFDVVYEIGFHNRIRGRRSRRRVPR